MLDRRTFKRHLARELLIENATKAPNIALIVASFLKNNLRCLVAKCTSFLYEALIVLEVARQTEVSNFDFWCLANAAHEDVLVLDVAVHNILFVDVLKPYSHLGEDVQYLCFGKPFLALSFSISAQVSANFAFGDDVVSLAVYEVVRDSKYVLTRLAFLLSINF